MTIALAYGHVVWSDVPYQVEGDVTPWRRQAIQVRGLGHGRFALAIAAHPYSEGKRCGPSLSWVIF